MIAKRILTIIRKNEAVIIGLLGIVFGVTVLPDIVQKLYKFSTIDKADDRYYLTIAILLIVAIAVLAFLIMYLNPRTDNSNKRAEANSKEFRQAQKEFYSHYKKEADKIISGFINSSSKLKEIESAVFDKVMDRIEGSLVLGVQEKYKHYIDFDLKFGIIRQKIETVVVDTDQYIRKLQKNSIVNLWIGIIATVAAIGVLGYNFLQPFTDLDWPKFLMHFIPKISFAVFIQLFAFFFLRLYRNNLEDAKYFQNELTNLNAKSAALQIAILVDNQTLIEKLISDLSGIERNFKLMKDESLHTIEKAKIEKEIDSNILDAFKDFLKIYKKE